jgi:hypothetical protein
MEVKVIDYVLQNCKETILEKNKMLNENWNSLTKEEQKNLIIRAYCPSEFFIVLEKMKDCVEEGIPCNVCWNSKNWRKKNDKE